MKRNILSVRQGVLSVIIMVGLLLGMLAEAKAAPYYQGKVIVFVVPSGAGGGGDMWARMVARHFGNFIPGKPSIVVQDVPTAGGLVGGNIGFTAKPNGLTILVIVGNTTMQNTIRSRGTVFKLEEMYPLYGQPEGQVYFIRPGFIKEPKDILTAKGLIFGHNTATSGTTLPFLIAHEMLGFECRMVLGYGGSGPARLAYLAGESNLTGTGVGGYNAWKPFVDRGEIVPLFQTGILDAGGSVVREKAVPNVPTMAEFYQQIYGKAPSGPFWDVFKLLVGLRTFCQALSLPPKTPAEVVNICRKAAIDMVKDPKFLDDAEKLVPGGIHMSGEDLVRLFPTGVAGKAETVKFMKDFLAKKYDVAFD